MARRDVEDMVSRLRKIGEEGLSSVLGEVFDNQRMRQRLGRAGKRILENKRGFDHNVETVLDFVSLPSKKDVRELMARLDHLSSQLVNLSIKVDRLIAKQSAGGRRGARKPSE
jgi:tetrahydromethanopterin S-methyltransferase subunit G